MNLRRVMAREGIGSPRRGDRGRLGKLGSPPLAFMNNTLPRGSQAGPGPEGALVFCNNCVPRTNRTNLFDGLLQLIYISLATVNTGLLLPKMP